MQLSALFLRANGSTVVQVQSGVNETIVSVQSLAYCSIEPEKRLYELVIFALDR